MVYKYTCVENTRTYKFKTHTHSVPPPPIFIQTSMDWKHTQLVDNLPSMHETLGSIPTLYEHISNASTQVEDQR